MIPLDSTILKVFFQYNNSMILCYDLFVCLPQKHLATVHSLEISVFVICEFTAEGSI